MRRTTAATLTLVLIVVVAGCKQTKERTARVREALQSKLPTPPPKPTAEPAAHQSFRGFDLTGAPRSTRWADLPDLWEEVPPGSSSYEMRNDVARVYGGIDGSVFHVPAKNCFYIQSDPLGSSTLTYFGPFEGDPRQILKLDAPKTAAGEPN